MTLTDRDLAVILEFTRAAYAFMVKHGVDVAIAPELQSEVADRFFAAADRLDNELSPQTWMRVTPQNFTNQEIVDQEFRRVVDDA